MAVNTEPADAKPIKEKTAGDKSMREAKWTHSFECRRSESKLLCRRASVEALIMALCSDNGFLNFWGKLSKENFFELLTSYSLFTMK